MYYQSDIFDEKFSIVTIDSGNINSSESPNSDDKLITILLVISIAVVAGVIIYYYRIQKSLQTKEKCDPNH
jgi:hypothetical protein